MAEQSQVNCREAWDWYREEKGTSRALRPGAALRGLLPAGKRGLTEIGINRTLSPRWNTAKVEIGAEILLRITGVWGRVLNGC
jgi:hypothetical protein